MRKPTFSLLDLAAGDADEAADPSFPLEGLCCPDDPLDDVISMDSMLDFGLWESLAVELPPRSEPGDARRSRGDDACFKSAEEDMGFGAPAAERALGGDGRSDDDTGSNSAGEDMVVDALPMKLEVGAGSASPENRLLPLPDVVFGALTAGAVGGDGSSGMSAPGSAPQNGLTALPDVRSATPVAPPDQREHDSPWSGVSTTTSAGSSTSTAFESPASASLYQAPAVPRRRRSRLTFIRKSSWSLVSPLFLLPLDPHSHGGGKKGKKRNAGLFISSYGGGKKAKKRDADLYISSYGGGKKAKKRGADLLISSAGGIAGGGGGYQRRVVGRKRNRLGPEDRMCSHCRTTETPQWRMGPNGPGTLCNACGIRYKMDKLLPEYMPSTSPTFESDKHSNRHRNVLKLREEKVLIGPW